MLNRIKAAYVGGYLIFCYVVTGFALWQLISHDSTQTVVISWFGVVLVTAPLALLIGFMMVKPVVARTSRHLPELHLPIVLGLAASVYGHLQSGMILPLVLAVIGYIGFLLYVHWYSVYRRPANVHLQAGSTLPEFNLTDTDGNQVPSHKLLQQTSIILFYRGNWCPLCMAQIKEVVASYHKLADLGAQVVLVSPQPHSQTRLLAKKFNVDFKFMTDKNNAAARTLGIVSEFGIPTGLEAMGYNREAPMPTVIITNQEGKVIWAHETDNYRVRPEPETFLEAIQAQG